MDTLSVEQYLRALENPQINIEFCKICTSELKSPIHARTHYVSTNHIKNVEMMRQRLLLLPSETWQGMSELKNKLVLNSTIVQDEAISHCKICNITLNGKWQVDNHHNDENHKSNLESYCTICHVKTISKEALLEHNMLFSHPIKKQEALWDEDGPTVPRVLVSPNVSPKKWSPKVKNKVETNLEQNAIWNCYFCHKTFLTESLLLSHRMTFPHTALESLKTAYSSEIIDAFCVISDETDLLCALCNVEIKSLNDTSSHFNGIKHGKRFKAKFKDLYPMENKINIETNQIKTNQTPEVNTYNAREVETIKEEIQTSIPKNNLFYCYVCDVKFDSKSEINVHVLSFPHVELAMLKSEIVSLGVPYAKFWTQLDNSYCCTLCDAKLFNINESKQHCKEPKHKERLTQWCHEFSSWKCGPVVDPKYFYCKTCDVALVGTTEAELHYKTKPHMRRVDFYCQICNVANATEEMYQEHNKSLTHQESAFKVKEQTVASKSDTDVSRTNNLENGNDQKRATEDKTSSQDPLDIPKKQQIFSELKKLIDTLYYSKSLPYYVSLNYLKNANQEIRKLKKKYQVKISPSKSSDGSPKVESLGEDVINTHLRDVKVDNKEHINKHLEDLKVDNKKYIDDTQNVVRTSIFLNGSVDVSEHFTPQVNVETAKKRVRSKRKKKCLVENTGEDVWQVFIEDKPKLAMEIKDVWEVDQNEDKTSDMMDFKDTENFKDMLKLIKTTRDKPDCEVIDMLMLNEIENLINLVNLGDLPLPVILDYLRNCNTELQHIVKGNENKADTWW